MRWKSMMSKSEEKGGRGFSQINADLICVHRRRSAAALLLLLLLISCCRRDMQDQPKMKPYRGTSFFGDGLSSRQPIEGTVARGFLRSDTAYYTGKKTAAASPTPGTAQAGDAQANNYTDDVDTFPFPVTKEIVMRGRERYQIFCSVCHGLTGNGDGMIVRRGFRRAASFNDDRLRKAPVGHYFDAVTNGWGAMPAYASQIAVQDRWAIISYIRALQTSQSNPAAASASPSPAASPGPKTPTASPVPTTGGRE